VTTRRTKTAPKKRAAAKQLGDGKPVTASLIRKTLRSHANKDIALHSQRFFKTSKGEYGEGDRFLGIRVPVLRKLTRQIDDVEIDVAGELLESRFHEERLLALLMLVRLFERGDDSTRRSIYRYYLNATDFINNWDLVDSSAPQIVGG